MPIQTYLLLHIQIAYREDERRDDERDMDDHLKNDMFLRKMTVFRADLGECLEKMNSGYADQRAGEFRFERARIDMAEPSRFVRIIV